MIINCNEDGMTIMDGVALNFNKEQMEEIINSYENYYEDENITQDVINKRILQIVNSYVNKYPIGKTIGAEFVSQDDMARLDAECLFEDIMEVYAEYNEGEE